MLAGDFAKYFESVTLLYLEEKVDEKLFQKYLRSGEFVIEQEKILQYLQSALFADKVVEITLDNNQQVFYARLHDDPPSAELEDSYTFGDYLQSFSHIVSLPLEPGLGNFSLRRSGSLRMRIFINESCIDLVTTYEQITYVNNVPMLRLAFPKLAHVRKHDREFRAYTPDNLHFRLIATKQDMTKPINGAIHNISANGIAFIVSKREYQLLALDDLLAIKIYLDDEMVLAISGRVCHITKQRHRQGIEYVCGVQLLFTNTLGRSKIGGLVATVQRAHLQEISRKSEYYGVHLII